MSHYLFIAYHDLLLKLKYIIILRYKEKYMYVVILF